MTPGLLVPETNSRFLLSRKADRGICIDN